MKHEYSYSETRYFAVLYIIYFELNTVQYIQ